MVDANVIALQLAALSDRISRVRAHCPVDPRQLAGDRDALDLVSWNLLLAVQTCLDVASHVIADERWAPVATARGALDRLQEQGVLSRQTALSLYDTVGLRNAVAHDSGVDPVQIHFVAMSGLPDLERFAAEVGAWVQARGTGED
jgi:uncharacterized protein YutE (UPF0331/DUF86 family)